ncbi:MAG: HEPN domain-containing protein, partial [Spirulinaceae cyanobacterium]
VKDLYPDTKIPFEDKEITEQRIALDFIEPEETIVLGLIENNEEVTLYKCFGKITNFDSKGRLTLFFQATYIFLKIHFQNEQEINFKSVSTRYSHLEEWVGKSGVQASFSKNKNEHKLRKLSISYQPPETISLAKVEELDISITFSQIYINPFDIYFPTIYYKGNVEQKTFLTLHNPQSKSVDKCVELIVNFRNFLSFAMSKPASITSVTGKIDTTYEQPVAKDDGTYTTEQKVRETQVEILFACWHSENYSKIKIQTHEMLFLYSDVENKLGTVFKEWLKKKKMYESVFELLMITVYTPSLYLHYGFLNIIQALEVYHGNKYKGTYQENKTYKEGVYKKLLEVIENFPSDNPDSGYGISDDFRAALKGKLNFLNQNSLQTRLGEIVEDITCLLPDDFIGDTQAKKEFIRKASNTRHALAHHNKKQKKKAAKEQELRQLFHTLTVILQACLLRELGLADESIKSLIKRNRKYQREWRSPSE